MANQEVLLRLIFHVQNNDKRKEQGYYRFWSSALLSFCSLVYSNGCESDTFVLNLRPRTKGGGEEGAGMQNLHAHQDIVTFAKFFP